MGIIKKTRNKLSQLLGYDLTDAEGAEVNKILVRPRIARIRQWDSNSDMNQDVLAATRSVVENYVRGKRKKNTNS